MDNKKEIQKMILLLAKYKIQILLMILLMICETGFTMCIPLLSKQIMDEGFIGRKYNILILYVLLQTIFAIVNEIINLICERLRISISSKLTYSLWDKAINHLFRVKMSYFDKLNQTEVYNMINADIEKIVSITDKPVIFMLLQIFSIIGGIVGLFFIDTTLAILVLLFIPVRYFVVKHFAKKQRSDVSRYIQETQEYARWFGDTLGGIEEIKLFNLEKVKQGEFSIRKKKVLDRKQKMFINMELNNSIDIIMIQLLIMLIYIVGSYMLKNLSITVGSVFAFITYSNYVISPISAILNIGYMFSGIIPSANRFFQFLQIEEECVSETIFDYEFNKLSFKDVCFCYENEHAVLNKVSVEFDRGSKTALIGDNGSGKTTMVRLITRMYEPQSGKILLNGKDISHFSIDKYRKMFSVVSQKVYLFDDTLRNNICLYKNISEESLWHVIKISGLEELVKERTLEYRVGSNGSLLSGGQKQKVALARALIHDRQVLIFDEVISNADIQSQENFETLLTTELKEKTIILITHRKNILGNIENVLALSNK